MRLEAPLRRCGRLPACALALACGVAAAPAGATEFEVQASTALQGYEVASPWGDVILDRRRFTQTIGLGLYNLQGTYKPGQPDYRVVLMVRINSDFGINANLPGS